MVRPWSSSPSWCRGLEATTPGKNSLGMTPICMCVCSPALSLFCSSLFGCKYKSVLPACDHPLLHVQQLTGVTSQTRLPLPNRNSWEGFHTVPLTVQRSLGSSRHLSAIFSCLLPSALLAREMNESDS